MVVNPAPSVRFGPGGTRTLTTRLSGTRATVTLQDLHLRSGWGSNPRPTLVNSQPLCQLSYRSIVAVTCMELTPLLYSSSLLEEYSRSDGVRGVNPHERSQSPPSCRLNDARWGGEGSNLHIRIFNPAP